MKIPGTKRKKALLIIDLQPAFLRPHNQYIIPNIVTLLNKVSYDAYVEALFHAEEDSLWKVQQDWISPKNKDTHTKDQVAAVLKNYNPLRILKSTRSAFKGNEDLTTYLTTQGIEELHLVGTETNDCVFATALEAFDLGFLPYIIEECCQSGTEGRHELGVKLLRMQGMTNNHCLANTYDVPLAS